MKLKINNRALWSIFALLIAVFSLTGCNKLDTKDISIETVVISEDVKVEDSYVANDAELNSNTIDFNISDVPEYSGEPSVEINNNETYFSASDKLRTDAFEEYSELDSLDRCGVAYANICKEIMPTEERGEIGSVKPSGWIMAKYNGYIEGNYLYNRCHLIGYQLAGENANDENLITGTRYMNCDGQLPYENAVDDYVDSTGNHVLYRVTPIFESNNLVASGVLTEAYSVEDNGYGINFCVYSYNVQPGIAINYATGESKMIEDYTGIYSTKTYFSTGEVAAYSAQDSNELEFESDTAEVEQTNEDVSEYVLNTNSMKIHKSDCTYAIKTSDANKKLSNKSVSELESEGYVACKVCNP